MATSPPPVLRQLRRGLGPSAAHIEDFRRRFQHARTRTLRRQQRKASILIEEKFGLVTAEKKRPTQKQSLPPDHALKIKYGEKPTTSTRKRISDGN